MSDVMQGLSTPYRGLLPYTQTEADLFFGRDNDRAIITSNLFASRLTLLFGPSGVGKSSVLRAGVAYDLQRQGHAVVVFAEWHTDPLPALRDAIAEEVNRVAGSEITPDTGDTFRAFLTACSDQLDNPLIIILDQFEEFLLYHPGPGDERSFISEFARVVNSRELRASFLVSIREDFVAELDRFKGRIPQLFSNYLRLDRLDSRSAHDAIEKPLKKIGWTWEPAVVSTVIDQVQPGRLGIDQGGGEVHLAAEQTGPQRVETPFLQIVMLRLWEEEKAQGSREIHAATLDRLGGPTAIVRQYLDTFMDGLSRGQQTISAQIFYHLVTPSGTKIAQSAHDLAYFTNIPEEHITEVLQALSGPARLLRTVSAMGEGGSRYEIFHDALARPMLDWRRRFLERQRAEEEQADRQAVRRRRLRRAALAGSVLALILVIWSQISATLQLGRKQLGQDDSERPLVIQQGFLPLNGGFLSGFPFFFGRQIAETDWDQNDLWEVQKKRVTDGEYYLPRDPFGSASWVGQIALDSPIEKAHALWLAGDTSASADVLAQALPKEGHPYTQVIINLIRFLDEYAPDSTAKDLYRQAFAGYLKLPLDTLSPDDKKRRDHAIRVLSEVGAPDEETLEIMFGLLDKASQTSGGTGEVTYILSFLGGMSGDDPQLGTLAFKRLTDFVKGREQSDIETAVIRALNGLKMTEPVSLTTYLLDKFGSQNEKAKNAAVDALSNIQFPAGYPTIAADLQNLTRELLDRAATESCPSESPAGRVLLRWAVRPETQYSDPVWSALATDFQQRSSKGPSSQAEHTGNPSERARECDIYYVLLKDSSGDLQANLPYDTTSLDQRVDFLLAVRDHPVLSSTVYTDLASWIDSHRKPMLALLTPERVAEFTRAASITDTKLVCSGCGFFSFVADAVRQGAWDRGSALALISKYTTATNTLNSEADREWLNLQTSLSPTAPAYNDELMRISRSVLSDTQSPVRIKAMAVQVLMDNHALVSSTLDSLVASLKDVPTMTSEITPFLWAGAFDSLLPDADRAQIIALLIQSPPYQGPSVVATLVERLADLGLLDEMTGRQIAASLKEAHQNSLRDTYYSDYASRLGNAIQRLLTQQPALARSMWSAFEPDLGDLLNASPKVYVDNLTQLEASYGSNAGLRGLLAALADADTTLRAPIARKLAQLAQDTSESSTQAYVLAALAGLSQTKEAWSNDFSGWATEILTDARRTPSDWWLWYLIARDQPEPFRPLAEAMIASLSPSFQPGDSLLVALSPMLEAYPDLIPQAGEALLTSALAQQESPAPQVIAALGKLAQTDASVMQRLLTIGLTETQQLQQAPPLAKILLLPELAANNPQLFTDYHANLVQALLTRGTVNARAVAALTLSRLRSLDDTTRSQWFATVETLDQLPSEIEARVVAETFHLANNVQGSQKALSIADRFWQQIENDDIRLDLVEHIGTTVSGTVSAETLYTRWLFSHFTPTLESTYFLLPSYHLATITDTAFLQDVAHRVLADWCSIPDLYQSPVLQTAEALVANQHIERADRVELAKSIIASLRQSPTDQGTADMCLDHPGTTLYDEWYLYRRWQADLPELDKLLAPDIAQLEAELLKTNKWSEVYRDNARDFDAGAAAAGTRTPAAQTDLDKAIALAKLGMSSKTSDIRTGASDLLSRVSRAQPVISNDVLTALAEPILSNDPDEAVVKAALDQLAAIDNVSSASVTDGVLISLTERLAVHLPDPYDMGGGVSFTVINQEKALDTLIQEKTLSVLTHWAARDEDLRRRIEAVLREHLASSNEIYADIYRQLALANIRLRAQPEPNKQVLGDNSEVVRLLIANGAVPSNIDPREFGPILNQLLDSPEAEIGVLAASGLAQQGQLSDLNVQQVIAALDEAIDRPVIERSLLERFTTAPLTDTLEHAESYWLERADSPDFAPVLKRLGDPLRRDSRQAAYRALLRWAANTAPDKITQRVEQLQSQLQDLAHNRDPQTRITANRTLEALYLLQRAAQVKLHSPEIADFKALSSAAPDWDARMTLPAQLADAIMRQREIGDSLVQQLPIQPDPAEPNDERSLAREARPAERLMAALDSPGDVDLYRFEAESDSILSVDIAGFSTDKSGIPMLWCVLDAEGKLVYCQSSRATNPAQLPEAGTYYLSVRDYPGDDIQVPYRYDLVIDLYSVSPKITSTPLFATVPPLNTPVPTPTPLPPSLSHSLPENEPNDQREQANPVRFSRPINAVIGTTRDMDWYEFTADTDQQVAVNLDYSYGGRPYVLITNKDGEYIAATYGSGGVVTLRRPLVAGTYYIRVSDVYVPGGPDYKYDLTVTSSRSTVTPPVTPTPASNIPDLTAAQPLTPNQIINGELTASEMIDFFRFSGGAGQAVTITVAITQAEPLDNAVCLIESSLGELPLACAGSYNTPGRLQLRATLPTQSEYYVLILRFTQIGGLGGGYRSQEGSSFSYSLGMELTGKARPATSTPVPTPTLPPAMLPTPVAMPLPP